MTRTKMGVSVRTELVEELDTLVKEHSESDPKDLGFVQ